jgi:hypothetical protein
MEKRVENRMIISLPEKLSVNFRVMRASFMSIWFFLHTSYESVAEKQKPIIPKSIPSLIDDGKGVFR